MHHPDIRLNTAAGHCRVEKMSFYYLIPSIVFMFVMVVSTILVNGVFTNASNEAATAIINTY